LAAVAGAEFIFPDQQLKYLFGALRKPHWAGKKWCDAITRFVTFTVELFEMRLPRLGGAARLTRGEGTAKTVEHTNPSGGLHAYQS
jgi:hypothetical protein